MAPDLGETVRHEQQLSKCLLDTVTAVSPLAMYSLGHKSFPVKTHRRELEVLLLQVAPLGSSAVREQMKVWHADLDWPREPAEDRHSSSPPHAPNSHLLRPAGCGP